MRKSAKTASKHPAHTPCAHPDCMAEGEYRAPKSRLHVEEDAPSGRHLYLCLDHVREYNKQWDYFSQMSMEEIDRFQREAMVGHRKTKPISGHNSHNIFFAQQDAWFFGFGAETAAPQPPKPKLSKPETAAMAVLDIDYPFTEKDLKSRYRTLVKKHHPDANGGDKKAEAQFKAIAQAYRVLKELC